MQKLNLPEYSFRLKNSENKLAIFDEIRKKFVLLTPEEWVRQHVVQFLIIEKKYPKSLINVEKTLEINGLKKRYDIVVFHSNGQINILVECKSADIQISQETFDQIARYNMSLKANFLMITNGLQHYFCQMNLDENKYQFLENIPNYSLKN